MTSLHSCTVRLLEGDGYCDFFSDTPLLRRAHESWFTGRVGAFGEAMLFKIESARHRGRYLAFTSHVTTGVEEQLLRGGRASVVVHDIKNPTSSFTGGREDFDPCGMSAIELIGNR
jgi:hypothetical protein